MPTYDAVVVGAGPNGLAAAIALQQAGLAVLLLEGQPTPGGGLRTAELTLPGFRHDICSAIHPLAAASPYFRTLPLARYSLTYCTPPVAAAHPFDDGTAVAATSLADTAHQLGPDAAAYQHLLAPLAAHWPGLAADVLAPLHWPRQPLALARFGLTGLLPATALARRFTGERARGLLAGMAAHAMQPLSNVATAAVAQVLLLAAHGPQGWPLAQGGSQTIADALVAHFIALGGRLETNQYVRSLAQLPATRAVLLDVTPAQLLQLGGHHPSALYRWQLRRYRYGMGVFKVDWALAAPIPFTAPECAQAGTVHLGGTLAEIAASEQATAQGRHPERPFVLLAQPSLFDATRAPAGQHTAWAYCHVPHGSPRDMTAAIEQQVERFAPGFRERILARHTFSPAQLEAYNPNYVGGDINGGLLDITQLFTRPALRASPYRTSTRGLYLCSSATPPGGGVHGMGGYYAARRALRDIFKLDAPPLATE